MTARPCDNGTRLLASQAIHTIESLEQLVSLYDSWPKPDEAAKWRAKRVQTGVTGQ